MRSPGKPTRKLHKNPRYQTGRTTNEPDRRRKAKLPGKRVAASGNRYTEHRRNRSDAPHKRV